MTTINKQTASVSTDCQCENEDGSMAEDCFGDCYEWQKEGVFELLGEWQLLNGVTEDDVIVIVGQKMGWQRLTGSKVTDILSLDSALSLDSSDFRIEWYLEDETLTARRWSHDEPTGTGLFTFTILKTCDKCGEPMDKDIHAEELGMCVECSNKYFDHEED